MDTSTIEALIEETAKALLSLDAPLSGVDKLAEITSLGPAHLEILTEATRMHRRRDLLSAANGALQAAKRAMNALVADGYPNEPLDMAPIEIRTLIQQALAQMAAGGTYFVADAGAVRVDITVKEPSA